MAGDLDGFVTPSIIEGSRCLTLKNPSRASSNSLGRTGDRRSKQSPCSIRNDGTRTAKQVRDATTSMPSVSLKSLLRGCSEGALVVLLLSAAAFLYWPALYAAGSRMDEATLLVYPELMLQGKIAYRDFETFYPPANLCTLAAAFRLFGISITTERVVGIVYRLVLFAGLYVAARSWGKIAAVGVIAIAAFVLLPLYLFANAWIMALGLALGSLSLLARSLPLPARSGTVIAGLTACALHLFY